MLKQYLIGGKQYQYEEGEQPAGAVEMKQGKPSEKPAETKAKKPPANKSRTVKSK